MIVAADRADATAPRVQSEATDEGDDVFATLVRRQPPNDSGDNALPTANGATRAGKVPSNGLAPGMALTNIPSDESNAEPVVEIVTEDVIDPPLTVVDTPPVLIEAVKVEHGLYAAFEPTSPMKPTEGTEELSETTGTDSADIEGTVPEARNGQLDKSGSWLTGSALTVDTGQREVARSGPRPLLRAPDTIDLVRLPANQDAHPAPLQGSSVDPDGLVSMRAAPDAPSQLRPESLKPARVSFSEVLTSVRAGGQEAPVVPVNLGKATFDAATQAVLQSNVERRDQVAHSVGEIMLRADVAAIMGHAGPAGATGTAAPLQSMAAHEPNDTIITTRAEDMVRDLAYGIARDFKAGNRWLDIRLDPAELGRIDVRLAVDSKGHLQAVIAADNPATHDLLRRESGALVRALQHVGVQTDQGSLQFELRSDLGRDAHHQAWSERTPADDESSPSQAAAEAKPAGRIRGHLI